MRMSVEKFLVADTEWGSEIALHALGTGNLLTSHSRALSVCMAWMLLFCNTHIRVSCIEDITAVDLAIGSGELRGVDLLAVRGHQ